MRRLIPALAFLAVLGCQSNGQPTAETQTVLVNALADGCHAYASALRIMAQAVQAGRIPDATIARIDAARPGITAICTGPAPADLNTAIATVASGLATIVAAEVQ